MTPIGTGNLRLVADALQTGARLAARDLPPQRAVMEAEGHPAVAADIATAMVAACRLGDDWASRMRQAGVGDRAEMARLRLEGITPEVVACMRLAITAPRTTPPSIRAYQLAEAMATFPTASSPASADPMSTARESALFGASLVPPLQQLGS